MLKTSGLKRSSPYRRSTTHTDVNRTSAIAKSIPVRLTTGFYIRTEISPHILEDQSYMAVILAIDAAWTALNPSGVALIGSDVSGWRCIAVAPSYDSFHGLAQGNPIDWNTPRFLDSIPDVPRLFEDACHLAQVPVDIITIDMPISTVPIVGRRAADRAISREFGSRGCSAHTPSSIRPGPFGAMISHQFAEKGYEIATTSDTCGTTSRLVEVYPHPALLILLRRSYRVPYKVSKMRKYWPELSRLERVSKLIEEFKAIYFALTNFIESCMLPIPSPEDGLTLTELKRYEDALDALVCAWVGTRYLNGSAAAFGNETGAIWCPF